MSISPPNSRAISETAEGRGLDSAGAKTHIMAARPCRPQYCAFHETAAARLEHDRPADFKSLLSPFQTNGLVQVPKNDARLRVHGQSRITQAPSGGHRGVGQQDGAHGLGGLVQRRNLSPAVSTTSDRSLMACT